MRALWRSHNGDSPARSTLDELIEERDEAEVPIDDDERILLSNILELRDRTVHDVMVPRADIIAVACNEDLLQVISNWKRPHTFEDLLLVVSQWGVTCM